MRVALCLYGLIGSAKGKAYYKKGVTYIVLEDCYNSFSKHILSKNDVDVFFHTWDTDFEDELVLKYNPKKYKVEPQKIFNDTIKGPEKRIQAHYSRWYSTKVVNELKSNYEKENNFEYDLVMISRFDMIWHTDVIFNDLDKNIFYIPGTTLGNKKWGWPHVECGLPHEIADLWFISNSINIDNFSKLYDLINQYIIKEKCPVWKHISNHMLAFYHLKKIELIPEFTKTLFNRGFPDKNPDFQVYREYKNN